MGPDTTSEHRDSVASLTVSTQDASIGVQSLPVLRCVLPAQLTCTTTNPSTRVCPLGRTTNVHYYLKPVAAKQTAMTCLCSPISDQEVRIGELLKESTQPFNFCSAVRHRLSFRGNRRWYLSWHLMGFVRKTAKGCLLVFPERFRCNSCNVACL